MSLKSVSKKSLLPYFFQRLSLVTKGQLVPITSHSPLEDLLGAQCRACHSGKHWGHCTCSVKSEFNHNDRYRKLRPFSREWQAFGPRHEENIYVRRRQRTRDDDDHATRTTTAHPWLSTLFGWSISKCDYRDYRKSRADRLSLFSCIRRED